MAENTEKGTEAKEGRKVFLSVLGTGFYYKCSYYTGDFKSATTRFIQRASLEYYGAKEWRSTDLVCFFLTEKAKRENWSRTVNKRVNNFTKTEDEYFGLKDELDGMGLSAEVRSVGIPERGTEEDIWETFRTIYDVLQDGDEVYLDITHAFRYLPMLVMVLLNYAKFLKQIKVMGIVYGNYENGDHEKGIAPMVDLISFSELQDWTAAADQYISTGSCAKLSSVYMPELAKTRREAWEAEKSGAKGEELTLSFSRRKAAATLQKLLKNMEDFGNQQSTCYGKGVVKGKTTKIVQDTLDAVKKISRDTLRLPEPFSPLVDRVGNAVSEYSEGSIRNLFLSARDCCNHQDYQQATTFLLEGTITFICDKFGLDWQEEDPRNCVSSVLSIISNNIPEYKWKVPVDEDADRDWYKQKMIEMSMSPAVRSIAVSFSDVQSVRNQYMHCGLLKSTQNPPDTLLKKIDGFMKKFSYEKLEEAFSKEDSSEELEEKLRKEDSEALFINFTNHPSSKWAKAQLEAARAMGTITDVPFPEVPTDIDAKAFDSLAAEYSDKLLKLAEGRRTTVHIQGEMTLVYRLVTELKAHHLRCLASVTKRNTVDLGDGKSQSVFEFAGFRDY